ncbi:MAG TPA: hypothetical protein VI233_12005 [Puia sp.]
MRDTQEITSRIAELRTHLELIQSHIDQELEKGARRWNVCIMRFLQQEYKIFEYAIDHLEWAENPDHQLPKILL